MQSFNELKLSPGTLDAITAMGYETPSPIQAQAIPHFLAGRDLLVIHSVRASQRFKLRSSRTKKIVRGSICNVLLMQRY